MSVEAIEHLVHGHIQSPVIHDVVKTLVGVLEHQVIVTVSVINANLLHGLVLVQWIPVANLLNPTFNIFREFVCLIDLFQVASTPNCLFVAILEETDVAVLVKLIVHQTYFVPENDRHWASELALQAFM